MQSIERNEILAASFGVNQVGHKSQNQSGLYRWTQTAADFYWSVEKSGPVKLKMSLLAFADDKDARLTLEGRELYPAKITPAPQLIEINFEAKAGVNRLRLESLSPVVTPRDLGQGEDTRPLAFLIQNLSVSLNE